MTDSSITSSNPPSSSVLWPGQPQGTRLGCSIERQSRDYELGLDAQYAANAAVALTEGFFIPNQPEFRFSDNRTSGLLRFRQGLDRFRAALEAPGGPPFVRAYFVERARAMRDPDPRRLFEFELFCEDHGVNVRYADETDPAALGEGESGDAARAGHFLGNTARTSFTGQELVTTRRRSLRGRRSRFINGFFVGAWAPYGTTRWLADARSGALLETVAIGAKVRRDGCAYKLKWTGSRERAVVRRVFSEAERGLSLNGIATRLNRDGIAPPSARQPASMYLGGGPPRWTNLSVRAMLMNRLYMGDMIYPAGRGRVEDAVPHTMANPLGSERILYTNFLPNAPIERAQWHRVQNILRGRPGQKGRKRSNPAYMLSGLVRCRHCGARCYAHTMRPKGPGGASFAYYGHARPRDGRRCPHGTRNARADVLDAFALTVTTRAVGGDDDLRADVEAELARQRAIATGPDTRRAVTDARRAAARHDAAAEQAVENAALTQSEPARARHMAAAEKFTRLAEAARADAERHAHAAARVDAAQARLDSATLGRADLAAALARADARSRKEIVQAVVSGVTVDFAAGTAEFLVAVLDTQAAAAGRPAARAARNARVRQTQVRRTA